MKGLLLMVVLAFSVSASAQRLRVHSDPDTLATAQVTPDLKGHLYEAGVSIRRSTNYDLLSWGLAAVSVISYFNAKNDDDKRMGAVCAVFAVAAKVVSINYRYKSGIELKLAAGSVSVSF